MRARPQTRRLPDGRLHLNDGPIDLVIEAFGSALDVEAAYATAEKRFATVLDELCSELPLLRASSAGRPEGAVARRMFDAVAPFRRTRFVTPMAAVAGAVADEMLQAMTSSAALGKAYVNNGGDIALHLGPDESFTIGMAAMPGSLDLAGRARIAGEDAPRGIATSGWRGRSFSLGVADAVTVIAATAALADAAATLIANAVDLPGHPAIARARASARDPESDLGDRLVTLDVGPLDDREIAGALGAGVAEAEHWRRLGCIEAAALRLGDAARLVGGDGRLYNSTRQIQPIAHVKKAFHAVG